MSCFLVNLREEGQKDEAWIGYIGIDQDTPGYSIDKDRHAEICGARKTTEREPKVLDTLNADVNS